jgi:hypothetical protein
MTAAVTRRAFIVSTIGAAAIATARCAPRPDTARPMLPNPSPESV